jgi:hypothetical protein
MGDCAETNDSISPHSSNAVGIGSSRPSQHIVGPLTAMLGHHSWAVPSLLFSKPPFFAFFHSSSAKARKSMLMIQALLEEWQGS